MRSACDEAPMSSVSSFLPAHAVHPSVNLALHEVGTYSRLVAMFAPLSRHIVINTRVLLCWSHTVRARAHAPITPFLTACFNIRQYKKMARPKVKDV